MEPYWTNGPPASHQIWRSNQVDRRSSIGHASRDPNSLSWSGAPLEDYNIKMLSGAPCQWQSLRIILPIYQWHPLLMTPFSLTFYLFRYFFQHYLCMLSFEQKMWFACQCGRKDLPIYYYFLTIFTWTFIIPVLCVLLWLNSEFEHNLG